MVIHSLTDEAYWGRNSRLYQEFYIYFTYVIYKNNSSTSHAKSTISKQNNKLIQMNTSKMMMNWMFTVNGEHMESDDKHT